VADRSCQARRPTAPAGQGASLDSTTLVRHAVPIDSVERSGMQLGTHGVLLSTAGLPAGELVATARALEALGYGAVWLPEVRGREPFATAALLLSHTERLIVATGILGIHGRDALVTAMGQQTLTEMSGGRFLLGLGVSHAGAVEARGHAWTPPLAAMRHYVAALRQCHTEVSVLKNLALEGVAPQPVERGDAGAMRTVLGDMPVVLAALGPRMTALAGEIAQGAHPCNTTPGHTGRCRQLLGPAPWLCPGQRVCLASDARRARAVGRRMLQSVLAHPHHRVTLLDCGFDEEELELGGSDRLVDALLGWGDVDTIRRHVQAHLEAGASHVCVQAVDLDNPARPCLRALRALREADSST
jgi:probable F420-dependent oxidoreductase